MFDKFQTLIGHFSHSILKTRILKGLGFVILYVQLCNYYRKRSCDGLLVSYINILENLLKLILVVGFKTCFRGVYKKRF